MAIEEFYGNRMNIGDPEKFFNLVEDNMDIMPVSLPLDSKISHDLCLQWQGSMADRICHTFVEMGGDSEVPGQLYNACTL